VRPFLVSSIRAVTEVDTPRYLSISLSKDLPQTVTGEFLREFIVVSPEPEDMKITTKGGLISIHGVFETGQYEVTLRAGLVST
ncbi:MAG: hypothetical protein GWO24_08235, partial [Akkermansiaceae bacterium]|nr:hypothetical protein [Akkermansiaceae bacterium]